MNSNLQVARPDKSFRTSIINFQSDATPRYGNMRAVTLVGRDSNADRIVGATKALQESVEEAFGKGLVRSDN